MSASHCLPDEAIRVRTTERGLPVELVLTPAAVALPPERLAREILLRCRLSARRAQLVRRERLAANGLGSTADALGLSTAAQLAEVRAELTGDEAGDQDDLPATWMRR